MADLENTINELTDADRLGVLLYLAYCEPNLTEVHLENWLETQANLHQTEAEYWAEVADMAAHELKGVSFRLT
jgi:hypothetical protein